MICDYAAVVVYLLCAGLIGNIIYETLWNSKDPTSLN